MDTASPSLSFPLATFQRPSRWITRERPNIACPWLGLSRLHQDDQAMPEAAQ